MSPKALVPVVIALAVLAAVAVPNTSAQQSRGDHLAVDADGRAQGRFVAFKVDSKAGAVCDWTFEGRTVIRAMAGVSGQARTDGRSVVLAGGQTTVDADACVRTGGDGGDQASTTTTTARPASATRTATGNATQPAPTGSGTTSATSTASTASAATGTATTSQQPASPSPRPQGQGGTGVKARLHDSPSGAIAFDLAAGQQVRLDLAAGIRLSQDGPKVRLDGDGVRGSLFLGQGSSHVKVLAEGTTVTLRAGDGHAKVHLRMDDTDLRDEEDQHMQEHVDDGHVACEAFVTDDDRPHVIAIGDANVSIATALRTDVRVDLDIHLDLDVTAGGGSTTTTTQSHATTTTQTVTHTATQHQPPSQTQTQTGGAPPSPTTGTPTSGCGCAAKVVILDVDVTVFVLDSHDDLLVRLNGQLLPLSASVEDALTIEAGEDPEALVVVNEDEEVKVLVSLAEGQSQVSMEAVEGEPFRTREPTRYSTTTTLDDDDGGRLVGLDDADVGRDGGDGADAEDEVDVNVPGPGLGVTLAAVAVAAAAFAVRRRLE